VVLAAVPGHPTLVLLSGPIPSLLVELQEGEEDSMKMFIGVMILIAFLASTAHAAIRYVGSGEAYATIQSAIDASSNGDVIIVRDGVYRGTGNRDIDFKGKTIHLKSENGAESCVINALGSQADPHRVFLFHAQEQHDSVVEGFTITGGYVAGSSWEDMRGAGVNCNNASSPTIANNIIAQNTATEDGGGIYCGDSSSPLIIGNDIRTNTAFSGGGGISCRAGASPSISNNRIVYNTSRFVGGGVYTYLCTILLKNNTIAHNSATIGGGSCSDDSAITVINCVVWGNTASTGDGIAIRTWSEPSIVGIGYSSVYGGQLGVFLQIGCTLSWHSTNIYSDPLFADPANGDYHLKSQYGRWDPTADGGAGWVIDDVTSPCINAGDPTSAYGPEPEPNGCRVNMGAYGNTPDASKGKWILPGDANHDSTVNVLDLIVIRSLFMHDAGSGGNWKGDVNEDGRINVLDLIYARNLIGTTRP